MSIIFQDLPKFLDGFINENKFELNPKENNLVENLEIYHGVAKNPLNYKKDFF